MPRRHEVEENPEGPDVALERVVVDRREVFGRAICDGPVHVRRRLVAVRAKHSEAEVSEFRPPVEVKENVFGLNVAVRDPLRVTDHECACQLRPELLDLVVRELPVALHVGAEIAEWTILEDDVELSRLHEEVVHVDDVRVMQIHERLDFRNLLAAQIPFIGRDLGGEVHVVAHGRHKEHVREAAASKLLLHLVPVVEENSALSLKLHLLSFWIEGSESFNKLKALSNSKELSWTWFLASVQYSVTDIAVTV